MAENYSLDTTRIVLSGFSMGGYGVYRTFWESPEMFEALLDSTNHLGLLSEDMDFGSRRLLGNFPQGYSHLALIDAAITLSNGGGSG